MSPHLTTTWIRVFLVAIRIVAVGVAVASVFPALDELVFHGLSNACADGYAEANGEPPCRPDWEAATPALAALVVSVIVAAASTVLLRVERPGD
jgi:hypothetical protein